MVAIGYQAAESLLFETAEAADRPRSFFFFLDRAPITRGHESVFV